MKFQVGDLVDWKLVDVRGAAIENYAAIVLVQHAVQHANEIYDIYVLETGKLSWLAANEAELIKC